MNAKKVKAIRKEMRKQGIDPTHALYTATMPKKNRKGVVNTGSIRLHISCGRYEYKQLKKAYK